MPNFIFLQLLKSFAFFACCQYLPLNYLIYLYLIYLNSRTLQNNGGTSIIQIYQNESGFGKSPSMGRSIARYLIGEGMWVV